MKITLHGAAGHVTGSAYQVQTSQANVLVDFGVFQGSREEDELNKVPRQLTAAPLDAVILTHGHLDHTGRLPLLVKAGYRGPIFATAATIELTGLILRDGAKIQAQDCDRINRKRERAGEPPIQPPYDMDDVDQAIKQMREAAYNTPIEIARGIRVRLVDSGHMLGSVSIEMTVDDGGKKKVVVFSGDIGPRGLPILKDSVSFDYADLVFMESTYGDRDHKSAAETQKEAFTAIRAAIQRKGKILVPAFVIGRAQQLQYEMTKAFRDGTLPRFPVYIDSPMAVAAIAIYARHLELLDEEADRLRKDEKFLQEVRAVNLCESADDSKAINGKSGPLMVIAGAGMCNAGRILHHLKQNLWKPETLVMIVGYQAAGTLGRQLVDGAQYVNIFGEKIAVAARVVTLGGYSAHAGQTDLLNWLAPAAKSKPQVVLSHGEPRGQKPLARLILERFGITAKLPVLGETIEL